MALVKCNECGKSVSSKARSCPGCGATVRKPKRGIFGQLFMLAFILFNIVMVLMLYFSWTSVGEMAAQSTNADAAYAGGAVATGLLLGLWAIGDIILGVLVLFTRPK